MNSIRNTRLLPISGLLLGVLVWLANNANPPTGRTGAPFENGGHCNNCHGGANPGNFDGTVDISGLPATIEPNTTYPMTLTMTPTAGSPIKGGFQLVVVNGSNGNAGNLAAVNAQTGTEFLNGREYIEHRNGKNFSGNPVSWDFTWTSPANAAGNTIKVYFIGNFTNGNNNDSGDFPIAFSETFAFSGPPPVTANIVDINNVSCFGGNNGSATVEADGGVPPYTYQWSNGQTGSTAVNLIAGNYTVTVTGSSGSGTATATATITQPTVLNASATVSGLITCAAPEVNVTATASGGTPSYTFEWSNGATGNPVSYSDPGQHTVTVTDNNGCTKVASFTINSNLVAPVANAGPAATLTCTQQTANLNGAGSSSGPNFSYLWTASNGGNILSGANTLTPLVNAAGTYTLQVTNNTNGCTAAASTTVTSNISPPGASATGGTLNCVVNTLAITASSMTPGVTYAWSGPGGFSSNQQNPAVSTAGNYIVTVTNPANSCTSTATAVVNQDITPPTAEATVNGTLTCAVTSVQLNIATNAANPTFVWSGPNGFNSTQQSPTVNAPGNYIGTVTNPANGCSASDTVSVTQNIMPPGATATANGQINCINASVQLNGNSPVQPVTFAWTGPNNFSSTQQNPIVNAPGNYILTVIWTTNGCTSTATTTVVQNITPPTASIASPANLNCNNVTIQLDATASSQGPNFTYLWTTPNGNIVSGATTLTPIVNAAGTYNLLVTNSENGCTSTASTTVNQTPTVSAITSVTNVSCNGGSNGAATVTGGGGLGNYTYAWSNGGNTATISNLPAGTYTVTITDSENCSATATATVSQPPVLIANASATGETANGANDGTATAAPTGGTPGYSYLWSNDSTSATIINLTPGTYTVTVTDANNCTTVQTVTVNSFNCNISATIASVNISCNGANDGSASVIINGAAQPVTYTWSNGKNTPSVDSLSPGSYSVSILDGNGCPASLSVNITQPPVLSANATATAETANGANDGTATAQPTGGTIPYTYLWSNDSATATITGLAPGSYSVTVTDENGCTSSQTVIVNSFNCAAVASISTVNVSCPETNNGQATVTLTGGTLPYTYTWSNGDTTATITNLAIGIYTVSIVDGDGCFITQTDTIVSGDVQAPTIVCPGNIQLCGADVVAYSAPLITDNCSLNGIQAQLISGLPSGSPFNDGVTIQVFRVTDGSGNSATCSFSVTINPLPDILVDNITNDSLGLGIGSIQVTPVGGDTPYVFIWRKNGEVFSNDEDLDSLNSGTYSLLLIDGNGCQTQLAPVTIGNTVRTGEPGQTIFIRLWPNPVRESFRVEMNNMKATSAQIFDARGRLVQQLEPSDLEAEISATHLPGGLFYLKMETAEGRILVAKWIKAD